jgi:hypothetical protein
MNINLKLILLGLLAMLLTILAFTAIEAALIRPRIVPGIHGTSSLPGTQVAAVDLAQRTIASTSSNIVETTSPSPALLLTLPSEPFSATSTPASPPDLFDTPGPPTGDSSQTTALVTSTTNITPNPGTLQSTTPAPTDSGASSGTTSVQGRVLFNGSLFSGTIILKLFDPVSTDVQQFTFMDGEYSVQNLQPSEKGYQIQFSRDDNLQLSQNQVVSQVLVGPIPSGDGGQVRYPDMDIALLGLEPLDPAPDTVLDDDPITPQQPVQFVWTKYPSLSQYRVELRPGRLSQPVWASTYLNTDNVVFDGVLSNGALIDGGTYWWSVSARSADGAITIVGPAAELTLDW